METEQAQDLFTRLQVWGADAGLNLAGAIAILIIGWWVAKLIRRIVQRMLDRAKVDPTISKFVSSVTYMGLMTFILLAVLSKLGVETTSFIAVIGAAGLAIGLALQGSLANLAGGLLIILFRPFTAGDFIDGAGEIGTVEAVHIFTTILVTPDNKTVIVPNAKMTGDNIVNYSAKGTRRVDLVVGVAYGEDLQKVKTVIEGVLAADERILRDPAPTVAVLELADSSVNFAVRPWTEVANYWGVYFDTLEAVKTRFDKEGISIPFPQTDVHIFQEAA